MTVHGTRQNLDIESPMSTSASAEAGDTATFKMSRISSGRPVRFGLDGEIDLAIDMFSRKEMQKSKVYWPKAFRQLLVSILKAFLSQSKDLDELSTNAYKVGEDELAKMISELELSTSTYIKVIHRRWCSHVLYYMASYRKKLGIPNRTPRVTVSLDVDWPVDIEDKMDLSSSLVTLSLREDVRCFLWRTLDAIIPKNKFCALKYDATTDASEAKEPIVIEVTDEYLDKVKDFIDSYSEKARRDRRNENYLPADLVKIVGIGDKNAIVVVEEGFQTTGSPWKKGTIGGVMRCGDSLYGIGSGHVHKGRDKKYDDLVDSSSNTIDWIDGDPMVDVSFPKFIDKDPEKHFNLLPLKFVPSLQEAHLSLGEDVYKIGRSTGLTVGTLNSYSIDYRADNASQISVFQGHVKVDWKNDGCRFAFSQDCGSLYCVKRGCFYVPIGIHRISGENSSYGCQFWNAMNCFEVEDDGDLEFVNAPFYLINGDQAYITNAGAAMST